MFIEKNKIMKIIRLTEGDLIKLIKRVINEDDSEIKLKSIFDKFMNKYTDLIQQEREYEDDDYKVYNTLSFYKKDDEGDIDEDDWEDDVFVFKLIPIDDYGNDLLLEYDTYFFSHIMGSFGGMFDSLLKEWFEEHYKYKISKVSGVR